MKLLSMLMVGVGLVSGNLLSIHPATPASGMLPRSLRVTLEIDAVSLAANPIPGYTFAAAVTQRFYTITFAGLTSLQGPAPDTNWVPFIKGISPSAFGANPPIAPVTATDYQIIANENGGPSSCGGLVGYTSPDGRSFTIIDWYACITIDLLWEFEIPAIYLASNPPFPEVLTSYTLSYTAAAGPVLFEVSNPWITTSTELIASALHFHRIVPSSTIAGNQLTSLFVSFTPGTQLLGGMFITLVVRTQRGTIPEANPIVAPNPDGLFQIIRTLTNLPAVPIGVDGCLSSPTDVYCCRQTVVSQPGDNDESLRFQLLPLGCALPAGKLASFTIPQPYLNRNPTLPLVPNPLPANIVLINAPVSVVYDAILITSGDTSGTIEGRYGRPFADTSNVQGTTAIDGDGAGLLADTRASSNINAPITAANYFTNWAIGFSTVTGFTAVPDVLTATVVPNTLTLSWILTLPLSVPAAPATPNIPPRFLVSANPAVFRRNVGSFVNQRTLIGMTPSACSAATFYTTEYGSLVIIPNPSNIAACTTALATGIRVTFVVPAEALLPNPSGAQTIRFDVRGIPYMEVGGAPPGDGAGGAIAYWPQIDAATLKDQLGYVTTTDCNTAAVPNFIFTSLTDIQGLQQQDRCRLVAGMTTLSEGGAAIKQCPVNGGSGVVTWAKIPEGTWTQSSWPLTNVAAQGNFAQVVGSNPTIAISNWGYMITYPMFAVVVTYPASLASLQALALTNAANAPWTIAFVIRMDRLTASCANANLNNPWSFGVVTTCNIVAVHHFYAPGVAGTGVEKLVNGFWAQSSNTLGVSVPASGAVVGYCNPNVSPVPGDGSDDALFGLLALIAVPVLLCCCLLALLWFLRPKHEPCPCVPEYPVQEMYWVNAQPCAPSYTVAGGCGPSTTPVYLVQ